MMLNWNASRYEKEILLTRNANLNILRIWGPTGVAPKALYDAADKYGIMIWQDFLSDFWGTLRNAPDYRPELSLYEKATTDIVKKYRNHPSLVIWCGGNEGPNPRQDLIMNTILKKYDNRDSRHYLKESNGDGLHGGGPYNTLEPKDYFTNRKINGFSSEIGPSGVPVYESMIKFMPEMGKKPWAPGRFPIDGVWAYHDANDWPGKDSRKFSSYDNIVKEYYGSTDSTSSTGVENYIDKSQLVNYDVYRASIEAINRQLWTNASGILLWKSNSSWPSITWQVYDWYLQANAGYYGAKKASEPVHVQLNLDNMSVSLVNLLNKNLSEIKLNAEIVGLNMEPIWKTSKIVEVKSNTVLNSDIIIPKSTDVRFLKLTAVASNGKVLSENTYWLNATYDFKALNHLPETTLEVTANGTSTKEKYQITINNKGKNIAFMVALKVVGKNSKQEILPSLWSDNYLIIYPGESKIVQVDIDIKDLSNEVPAIEFRTYGKIEKQYIDIQI
jgi:beta-galactosidase/beta-glucuronidase